MTPATSRSSKNVQHDEHAESAVLGAILLDNSALHRADLPAEAVFNPRNRIVYDAILRLDAAEFSKP